MSKEKPKAGETQETRPKKGKSTQIPIPTKREFFRDLAKVAKPRKKLADSPAEQSRADDQLLE